MWCRLHRSMAEYVAGSSDIWQNERHLISHSIVINCGVSLHLNFMKPTQAWENETLITHILPFFAICSNSYTRMLDRWSTSCASMTLTVIQGIWYLFSRTQQELHPVWRLPWLGILYKRCACTTFEPHPIRGLWAKQQQWCFLLRSVSTHCVVRRIHAPVNDRYRSNHPTSLSDRFTDIQTSRKLTDWLYLDHLPSLWAARRL